jgi:putative oxidoreductase
MLAPRRSTRDICARNVCVVNFGEVTVAFGILLLRVVVGLTFAAHGTQKLFGWFGGPGLKGASGFFGALGFRPSAAMALLAALAETSGVLFALGLFTPLAALGLVVVMLNAVWTVHLKNGFFNGAGGYEFNLVLATVAVAVAATGPGRYSLDRALGWDDNWSGAWWGIGVAVAALLISVVILTAFRTTPAPQEQPT